MKPKKNAVKACCDECHALVSCGAIIVTIVLHKAVLITQRVAFIRGKSGKNEALLLKRKTVKLLLTGRWDYFNSNGICVQS